MPRAGVINVSISREAGTVAEAVEEPAEPASQRVGRKASGSGPQYLGEVWITATLTCTRVPAGTCIEPRFWAVCAMRATCETGVQRRSVSN